MNPPNTRRFLGGVKRAEHAVAAHVQLEAVALGARREGGLVSVDRAHGPGTMPQVTLTIVAVMPAARSDARNSAVSATSSSCGRRWSGVIEVSAPSITPWSGTFADARAEPLVSERMTPSRGCPAVRHAAVRAVLHVAVSPSSRSG